MLQLCLAFIRRGICMITSSPICHHLLSNPWIFMISLRIDVFARMLGNLLLNLRKRNVSAAIQSRDL